jgi:hypothetical protein
MEAHHHLALNRAWSWWAFLRAQEESSSEAPPHRCRRHARQAVLQAAAPSAWEQVAVAHSAGGGPDPGAPAVLRVASPAVPARRHPGHAVDHAWWVVSREAAPGRSEGE